LTVPDAYDTMGTIRSEVVGLLGVLMKDPTTEYVDSEGDRLKSSLGASDVLKLVEIADSILEEIDAWTAKRPVTIRRLGA